MRTLAITQNTTLDGSVEMLGHWFDAQGQGDDADLMEVLRRDTAASDAFLVGRRTFEDMRGYWPHQTDDTTGVTAHLDQVAEHVVSSTLTGPTGSTPPSWPATPPSRSRRSRSKRAATSSSPAASPCATS